MSDEYNGISKSLKKILAEIIKKKLNVIFSQLWSFAQKLYVILINNFFKIKLNHY